MSIAEHRHISPTGAPSEHKGPRCCPGCYHPLSAKAGVGVSNGDGSFPQMACTVVGCVHVVSSADWPAIAANSLTWEEAQARLPSPAPLPKPATEMPEGPDARDTLALVRELGWKPLRIPRGEKGPTRANWQTSDEPDGAFESWPWNLGIQVGAPSGGLAVLIANTQSATDEYTRRFGPPTAISKRGGHWYGHNPSGIPNISDRETPFGRGEFYAERKQVVAPGSLHPSGVLYRWGPGGPAALRSLRTWTREEVSALFPGALKETARHAGSSAAPGQPPATNLADLMARVAGSEADGPVWRRVLETTEGGPRTHETNLALCWVLYRTGATVEQTAGLLGGAPDWGEPQVRATYARFRAEGAYAYSLRSLAAQDPIVAKAEEDLLPAGGRGPAADDLPPLWADKTDGRGNRVGRQPDPLAFVEHALRRFRVATMRDTEEIYVYGEGYYRRDETRIKEWLEEEFRAEGFRATNHFVAETLSSIQRRTYEERSAFEKVPKVALANGTLNTETGLLEPWRPEDKLLVRIPIRYDPAATCPLWLRVLERILPEESKRLTLQEWFGYHFVKGQPYKAAFFGLGETDTGKSTVLTDVLLPFLGGRENVSNADLVSLSENRFAAARLEGKLANIYPDLDARQLRSVGKFQGLTGRDALDAERKGVDAFSLVSGAKLSFSANTLPQVRDATMAFFSRWIAMEFTVRIPKAEQDRDLPAKLAEEFPGILNWALEGLRRLRARNGFVLDESVAKWWLHRSDSLQWWVDERIVKDSSSVLPKAEASRAYLEFCEDEGAVPATPTAFGRRFPELCGAATAKRTVPGTSERVHVWTGVRLRKEREAEGGPPPGPRQSRLGGPQDA